MANTLYPRKSGAFAEKTGKEEIGKQFPVATIHSAFIKHYRRRNPCGGSLF